MTQTTRHPDPDGSRPRPSPTLWRSTLWELLKLVGITAAILVVVVSFAASVRWVAEGKLGPFEMLRFVALAAVPMLAYVLPFAAGFGATLCYHRMSQDNEVSAQHAGGIGHRGVLAPAVAVGLLLSTTLALLNEQAIPRLLRGMESLVTDDLAKVLVGAIDRGDSVRLGDFLVSADQIMPIDPAINPAVEASGARDWLVMRRFMAVKLDKLGNPESDTTAHEAHLFFFPAADGADEDAGSDEARGYAQIHLYDVVGVADGQLGRFEESRLPPVPVPFALKDDPKFLTFGALREVTRFPDRMHFVRTRRAALARSMAYDAVAERLKQDLASDGRCALETPGGGSIILRGSRLLWNEDEQLFVVMPAQPGGDVLIEEINAGNRGFASRTARRATIKNEPAAARGDDEVALDLTLTLESVSTASASAAGETQADASGQRRRLLYTGLRLADDPLDELASLSSAQLLERDRAERAESGRQKSAQAHDLERRIAKLNREVLSKQHERMAMAASCFVMILCGSVTALRLGSAMPLTVYMWSFFPALGCLVTVSSGQQFVHESGPIGLIVLWGGVLALAVYTVAGYRAIARH